MITCDASPDVTHAQRDSDEALWGSVVTYTCDDIYEFSDGSMTFSIECLESSNWTATPEPSCQREYKPRYS